MKGGRKALSFALKLAFVVGLLYLLARKGFISMDATARAFGHAQLIYPAFFGLFAATALGFIRWQWLLIDQGIRLRWSRVLQLTLIGNFFNIALPGAVSGDFVKAFYVAREGEGQRARAFGSIVFDRLAGLSALVLVSAGAMALDFGDLWGSPLFQAIRAMMILGALAVVFFYGYLFLVQEHRDPLLKFLRRIGQRYPKLLAMARIYEGVRHYHHHRVTVLKVLLLSVLIHLTVCTCCVLFARALGDLTLPVMPVYVVVPLGLLVTAVPVMPAGVGTGHAAFGWLFHFLGSQRGADVFSLFALSQIFGGAIGGIVYLRFKGRGGNIPSIAKGDESNSANAGATPTAGSSASSVSS